MSKKNLLADGTIRFFDKDGNESTDTTGYVSQVLITLDPTSDVYEEIQSRNKFEVGEGQAAIRAAADLLAHGLFDHPLTDMVLGTVFVRANADLTSKKILSNLGFITEDNDEPRKFGKFYKGIAIHGVNQLHRRGGHWVQGPVEDGNQSRYVFWMQQHLLGNNTSIRIVPWLNEGKDGNMGWIQTILTNLAMEDYEERLEVRNENIQNFLDSQRRYTRGQKQVKEVKQGRRELAGTLTVKIFGTEEEVDALTLPPQTIIVHPEGQAEYEIDWDTGTVSRLMLEEVALFGHTIELES